MNLIPTDGETQPDFAIRFHEATQSALPNTEERNQRCWEVWATATGEQEVQTARRYHKADEFRELRNVCVFAEHSLPSQKLGNGQFRKGVTYDKYALASMVNNMNSQLMDVGKCCPLTNGHTSENARDPQPEVLGFTGAYRLGMIGSNSPKWAIFADEYHRKDREQLMKYSIGRSVEILPLPDVHSRTIYPIAVLSAEEPRLDLPPARYCNRIEADGSVVEVERYQMALPGGSNVFVPSHGDTPDKYGDMTPEQELPQGIVKSVCEALWATAPFQYLIAKMEEDGKSGAVNPMVHQPPEIADMPVDNDGMGGMGMPSPDGMQGQSQPGGMMPPSAGSDMGAVAPQMPPEQDAGGMAPKPPFNKGMNPMAEDKQQYSKSAGLAELEARLAAVEAENKSLKAKLIGSERYSKLASLQSEGYELNLDKELAKATTATDEQFTVQVETIREHYRKSPTAVADFSTIAGVGRQNDLPSTGNGVDDLAEIDVKEVQKYALRHGVDYVTARETYIKEKAGSKKVAG